MSMAAYPAVRSRSRRTRLHSCSRFDLLALINFQIQNTNQMYPRWASTNNNVLQLGMRQAVSAEQMPRKTESKLPCQRPGLQENPAMQADSRVCSVLKVQGLCCSES